jgi:hypothetical protein
MGQVLCWFFKVNSYGLYLGHHDLQRHLVVKISKTGPKLISSCDMNQIQQGILKFEIGQFLDKVQVQTDDLQCHLVVKIIKTGSK